MIRQQHETALSHREASANPGWAPRMAQESRLRQLQDRIRHQPVDGEGTDIEGLDLEIERAVLLAALNRQFDAQQAFVDILRRAPENFSALNEFGTLLASMGAISAACRVYSEAIAHHPENPIAHVNLANLLLRANEHEKAREHYEAVLRIDPEHAPAHQGIGAVLSDLGDRAGARYHFGKGFRDHAISTLPYRGNEPPITLLQLVSSGGGNIPTASFLDDRIFLTSVIVADYLDPTAPLPPHQLVFNTIGDVELCEPALEAAVAVVARTTAPVIHDPRAVMKTSRIGNSQRLRAVPGVVTPQTTAIARALLAGPNGADAIENRGFTFPLLLRSPGYHTGRNFILVESAAGLAAAAASLPGDSLLVIEYLDARGRDGKARKYRVMMIGGELYPLHLAFCKAWKVHYFTSDMANEPDLRLEEANFLGDMPAALGGRAMAALQQIQALLGLDYAGIDFGLGRHGDLLLFEANANMVIASPGPEEHWAYRRGAIDRALGAVVTMIRQRSTRQGSP